MGSNPFYLTASGGFLYFTAQNTTVGAELWKTDGAPQGTILVKDLVPGITGSYPYGFTVVNNELYFVASVDGLANNELWKTDGTEAGTVLVKDIFPGPSGSFPAYSAAYNGKLYFSANDGIHGRELWESDGTATGTVLVSDLFPGTGSGEPLCVFTLRP